MQSRPTIFSFTDPVDFLNFEFRHRQRKNPRFSLRAWARQLGYENPSFLSHILKKNRRLKIDLANRLAENLQLAGKERKYFELIVLKQSSGSDTEKKMFQRLIVKARPNTVQVEELTREKFELASEWYHWVIIELFYLKDFRASEDFIASRLGAKVSRKTIRDSLKTLTDLGFIENTADGGFRRATDNPLFMKQFPTWAAALYHKSMIGKAIEALDRKSAVSPYLRGTTLALTDANFTKAKEIISEAHKKILALAANGDGDDIYHFSSQLFTVTENSPSGHKEEKLQ